MIRPLPLAPAFALLVPGVGFAQEAAADLPAAESSEAEDRE